jgi:hypothetical protein
MILPLTEIVSLLPLDIGCDGAKRCWGCAKGEQPFKRAGEHGVDFVKRWHRQYDGGERTWSDERRLTIA